MLLESLRLNNTDKADEVSAEEFEKCTELLVLIKPLMLVWLAVASNGTVEDRLNVLVAKIDKIEVSVFKLLLADGESKRTVLLGS